MSTILLVEDSVDSFNLVKRAMGTIALDWAKNLAEANAFIQRKTYDLIILDVMLPDGDGYRLCSILQTDDRLKNVPVMFLTGKNSVSDKVLGFSVGADDFLTKPFDPIELKARVDSKLRRRQREKVEADVIRVGDLEILDIHVVPGGHPGAAVHGPSQERRPLRFGPESDPTPGRPVLAGGDRPGI
ncbi:MAG: response regulator transcription factor, partial [Bdellovibrionota bacterium]